MADRQKFNPATKVYQKLFGEGDDNPYASSIGKQRLFADDQSPTGGVDDIDQARDLENQGSDFGYQPQTIAQNIATGKGNILLRFGHAIKKGGPAGFIIGSLLTGFAFFSSFAGPAGVVSQLSEQLTEKFNYQDVSASVRTKKIINMKKKGPDNLYGLITKQDKKLGFVGPKGRATRFGTVSDKMIARMQANGVEVKTEPTFFGKKRVTEVIVNDSSLPGGKKVITSASELTDFANKNTVFFDKIVASGRGKFGLWFDGPAGKIKQAMSLKFERLKSKLSSDTEGDETGTKKKSNLKDLDENLESAVKEGVPDEATIRSKINTEGADPDAIKSLNEAVDESELTKKNGFNSSEGVNKVLGVVDKVSDLCSVYNIINGVEYLTKVVKAVQLARYASKFLATAAALKAGDATEEEVAYFANKLTATQPITKNINGRQELISYTPTAMDSQGMYYVMTGLMGVPNESTKQFQLGVNDNRLMNAFYATKNKINEVVKEFGWNFNITQFCHLMDAPIVAGVGLIAGIAACLALGPVCLGAISVGGVAFEFVKAAGFELGKVWLSDQIQKSFGGSYVTKKTQGEDAGNALVAGSGYLMSKNATAGGNMPLTKTQALAYMQARDDYIAQRGEYIRATHSPFDITTRHTMMGSVFNKAMPYMAKMQSFAGKITAIARIGFGFINDLTPGANALSEAEKNQLRSKAFDVCTDFNYSNFADVDRDGVRDVALDPYCNWVVGIPVRELNSPSYAPSNVINYLAPGTFKTDNRGVVTSIPDDYLMTPELDEKGNITNVGQLESQGRKLSNYVTAVLQKGYFKPVDKNGNDCSFEPIIYSQAAEGDKKIQRLISGGATGREIMYTPGQISNPCLDETGYAYEFEWKISDRNSASYFTMILEKKKEKDGSTSYNVKKYEYEPDLTPRFKKPDAALQSYKSRRPMVGDDLDCDVSKEDYFIQDDKFNPLLRFRHNCLSRGELPFGMDELQESGKQDDYIKKSWGRRAADWLLNEKTKPHILDKGSECILSGESEKVVGQRESGEVGRLVDDKSIAELFRGDTLKKRCEKENSGRNISSDKERPARHDGPRKYQTVSAKDRIMIALYYMDERIQCMLDEGEDCDQEAMMSEFGRPKTLEEIQAEIAN